MATSRGEKDVRYELYSHILIGDTINILRSIGTNAKQKIEFGSNGKINSNDLGFSREIIRLVFLGLMASLIIVVMILDEKISHFSTRTNGTIFLVLRGLLFFYTHLK